MDSQSLVSLPHRPSGLIVSGLQSGSGKTAVTCLLLAAARARGLDAQPFKVGPDYLDPGYHSRFAGVESRNLDSWLMGRDGVLDEAASLGAGKIGIVEGVMGLFDGGVATSDEGSAMELARWLRWPVLLVIPCAKAGRSLATAIRGFLDEAGREAILGLILNGVSGDSHTSFLKEALAPLGVPVLGALPPMAALQWPERHLGLQSALEASLPSPTEVAAIAKAHLDLDSIFLKLAPVSISAPPNNPKFKIRNSKLRSRIALARDAAFHFYYPSNLDWLRLHRVELIEFSPLNDTAIPADIDGVIFGGGFPEVFA